MTIANEIKITKNGLFIPREAYERFGEIEIVQKSDSIVIRPRSRTSEQVVQALQQTGLLLNREELPRPEQSISPEERRELARKFGVGRPLSELIIEERAERW